MVVDRTSMMLAPAVKKYIPSQHLYFVLRISQLVFRTSSLVLRISHFEPRISHFVLISTQPSFPIQTPVLYSLSDMLGLNTFSTCQVGNGPGYF